MKDSYISAKLINPTTIRVMTFTSAFENSDITMIIDEKVAWKMSPSKVSTMESLAIQDYRLSAPLELGHSYKLAMVNFGIVGLNVDDAASFPGFDEEFAYDGDDLGYTYSKDKCSFAIWAPIASKVILKYRETSATPWLLLKMDRGEKGVYRCEVKGDLNGYEYTYMVFNSEISREVSDPYAKGSTPNSVYSVVIDFSKMDRNLSKDKLPKIKSLTEAVIYETHVRDFTIDRHSDIVNKGKYLGLAERGRKSEKGNPAGLDYLVDLGITHLQLQPIYDYATVDELQPDASYNWGYDPAQYMVPEGSYATNVIDPFNRIIELKSMVNSIHQAGIRVIMDVVFNHVYEGHRSILEKVVPGYYFRKRPNGKFKSQSGCGNDLSTERPMVRKLIVDASTFWVKEYGIDGFRIDLMGLIDSKTIREIELKCKAIDPSFMIYGEGWHMDDIEHHELANMDNSFKLPSIGFFNDLFRESYKRYSVGQMHLKNDFKHALLGSCLDVCRPKKFLFPSQSINYVECHDDGAYIDHVNYHQGYLSEKCKLDLSLIAVGSTLLSFGVPFIHAGEELGASKWGVVNTYNKGDHFNKFSYSLLDKREWMAKITKNLISLRKKLAVLLSNDVEEIAKNATVMDYYDATILRLTNPLDPNRGAIIVINPTGNGYTIDEERVCSIYLDTSKIATYGNDSQLAKKLHVSAYSLLVYGF